MREQSLAGWCVGEYAGTITDPGLNTRLYNLRAE